MMRLIFYILFFSFSAIASPSIKFPGDDNLWGDFDDTLSGGISKKVNLKITDTCIEWVFNLKKGPKYQWPYVGLCRLIKKPDASNFSPKDTFLVDIVSNCKSSVIFQLSTFDPKITKHGNPLSNRILQYETTVQKYRQKIEIPLEKFRIPDWWRRQNDVSFDDDSLYLDSLILIQLVVEDSCHYGKTDTIRIHNLNIKPVAPKHPTWLFPIATVVMLILTGLVTFLLFKKHNQNKSKSWGIEINRKHIFVGSSDWKRVLDYVENNYSDQNIRMKKVAEELGFSESKLSRLFKENFPSGFRSLINTMRIEEGKRLIKETDLNIAEIAYKVGFATPSQFSREFKSKERKTAGEFRKYYKLK